VLPREIVSSALRRDYRIDLLRGLSILSVLLLHFNLAYRLLKSPVGRLLPGPYLVNLVWNGNYGVTVFFVISGYLITSTSLRRFGGLESVSAKTFYAYRFARIIPCLVLVLAIISGLAWAGVRIFQDTEHVSLWLADLSILTFWHNLMMAKFGYFNYCLNIFWSLSVEEVFYLAFPLLCLLLRRARWIMLVWVAAIILGPIYRGRNSHDEIKFLYGYLACFDAISMGCIVAVLTGSDRVRRISGATRNVVQLIAISFMLWIFMRAGIDSVPVWGTSLMALGAAVFLFAEGAWRGTVASSSTGKLYVKLPGKLLGPLAWFGQHSYELYLFHIVLLAGMMANPLTHVIAPAAKPVWFIAFLAASALVAWGIARFYSEPLNRWLRELLIARRTAF
jgi:peptidoglycan/LPS O-acetylase OafA/YrhL